MLSGGLSACHHDSVQDYCISSWGSRRDVQCFRGLSCCCHQGCHKTLCRTNASAVMMLGHCHKPVYKKHLWNSRPSCRHTGSEPSAIIDRYSRMKNRQPSLHTMQNELGCM